MPPPITIHANNVSITALNPHAEPFVPAGGGGSNPVPPRIPARIGGGDGILGAGPRPPRPPLQAAGSGGQPPGGPGAAGGGGDGPNLPPVTNHMEASGEAAIRQMRESDTMQARINAVSAEMQANAALRAAQAQVVRDMNQTLKDAVKDQGEAGKKP